MNIFRIIGIYTAYVANFAKFLPKLNFSQSKTKIHMF